MGVSVIEGVGRAPKAVNAFYLAHRKDGEDRTDFEPATHEEFNAAVAASGLSEEDKLGLKEGRIVSFIDVQNGVAGCIELELPEEGLSLAEI